MTLSVSQRILRNLHAVHAPKVVPFPPPASTFLVFTTKQVVDVNGDLSVEA